MSSWNRQTFIQSTLPNDILYCSISYSGYGSNFFNFFMCYLYARNQNKILYLRDTSNNISDSFHLILDTFQDLPGITYSFKKGITIQQKNLVELKKFCKSVEVQFLKSEAKRIFKIRPSVQSKITLLHKGLPNFDLGLHIRTGDKITTGEMEKIPLDVYIKAVEAFQKDIGKEKLSIYLMTDSEGVITSFKKRANPSWSISFLPSPIKNLDGHDQRGFNSHSIQEKMDAYIHFLAELQILQKCPTVFCTFSSNIGRFVYLTGREDVRSLDKEFEL